MATSSDFWLDELRGKAKEAFDRIKFPTIKDEEWRYIDYRFLKQLQEMKLDGKSEVSFKLETESAGVIATKLQNSLDSEKRWLGKLISENSDKFMAAHYANITDGLFLFLPKNSSAAITVNVSGKNSSVHNVIVLEQGAKLNYLENYSEAENFLVDATEIFAAENSQVNFQSFQNFSPGVFHISHKKAALQRYAVCDWNIGCFGGKFSRWKIETSFEGEGAQSENIGIFFGNGDQHIDISTIAHHVVPNTTSNILMKGAMRDSSSSVYRGLIRIEKAAQKTDSYLADHTMLLSEKAFANSIPSLQIEANDVRATHGATVGKIDKDQMFYLTSRGLSENEAERLIVKGFFEHVFQKIVNEELRNRFQEVIDKRLSNES